MQNIANGGTKNGYNRNAGKNPPDRKEQPEITHGKAHEDNQSDSEKDDGNEHEDRDEAHVEYHGHIHTNGGILDQRVDHKMQQVGVNEDKEYEDDNIKVTRTRVTKHSLPEMGPVQGDKQIRHEKEHRNK